MPLTEARGGELLKLVSVSAREDKKYLVATPDALKYWTHQIAIAPDDDTARIGYCQTMRQRVLCMMRAKEPRDPSDDIYGESLGDILTELDRQPGEHAAKQRKHA